MKTTREGKRFFLAALLIAVAAVNTGNNLIYLILALMLSFLLLSLLILRWNLSGLSLAITIQQPVFAGEQSSVTFSLSNEKKYIQTYSVNVNSRDIGTAAYFPAVPPKTTLSQDERPVFARRGLYRYGSFRLSSSFPYILFTGSRLLPLSGEILVYPQLRDVDNIIAGVAGTDEGEAIRTLAAGEELYAMREFRYGDDWRKIHWKASAKTSSLLVKEYAEHELRKVSILIDNIKPFSAGNFEKAVSLAASLSRYFLLNGFFTRVMSCRKVIPFGSGEEHLYTILDILAVIEEEDVWDCPLSGETEGFSILVLKSPSSPLSRYREDCDMVVYADSL